MTRKELTRSVSEDLGIDQSQARLIVQLVLDTVLETLATEGRVELRNFGVFQVQRRAARKARNPRTGEAVDVPERYVVTFRPGLVMEQRISHGLSRYDPSATPPPGEPSS